MKKLIIFLSILSLILIIGMGIYSMTRPRDLKVSYTEEDINKAKEKMGIQIKEGEIQEDLKLNEYGVQFGEPKNVNTKLSSAEITGLVNSYTWKYFPLSKVQIKFNGDKGELSSNVHIDRIIPFVKAQGFTNTEIQTALEKYNLDKISITTLYISGRLDVKNNVVNLDLSDIKIAGISLPSKYKQQGETALEEAFTSIFSNYPGGNPMQIEKVSINESDLEYKGTMPKTTIYKN